MKQLKPDLPLLSFEVSLKPLYKKAKSLQSKKPSEKVKARLSELHEKILIESKSLYKKTTNWDKTQIARHPHRPFALDYVEKIFSDFELLHGDRNFGDDNSIVAGLANFEGRSVVIVGQQKGRTTKENLLRNFGMPKPEGYRKALKIFEFANKFKKPIITFIDTAGAYPGLESEERSVGEAIARNLKVMSGLSVPNIAVVIGEGGSGGALGIAVANIVLMLEHSIYSVISPESCASILWHDASKKEIAAAVLKNDAKTALKLGVIDEIISEGCGGAHRDWDLVANNLKKSIGRHLNSFAKYKPNEIKEHRLKKFAKIGEVRLI